MNANKLTQLLKSRKFWAMVIGLIITLTGGDPDSPEMTQAITGLIVASFSIATAIEDGLSRRD